MLQLGHALLTLFRLGGGRPVDLHLDDTRLVSDTRERRTSARAEDRGRSGEATNDQDSPATVQSVYILVPRLQTKAAALNSSLSVPCPLGQGNACGIRFQPLGKRLQPGIERTGDGRLTSRTKHRIEVAFELKHAPEIVGSGKSKGSIDLRRHGLIPHLPPEGLGQGGRHVRAGQMLSGDADRLPELGLPLLQDP